MDKFVLRLGHRRVADARREARWISRSGNVRWQRCVTFPISIRVSNAAAAELGKPPP
jgi:hypothetical protein